MMPEIRMWTMSLKQIFNSQEPLIFVTIEGLNSNLRQKSWNSSGYKWKYKRYNNLCIRKSDFHITITHGWTVFWGPYLKTRLGDIEFGKNSEKSLNIKGKRHRVYCELFKWYWMNSYCFRISDDSYNIAAWTNEELIPIVEIVLVLPKKQGTLSLSGSPKLGLVFFD